MYKTNTLTYIIMIYIFRAMGKPVDIITCIHNFQSLKNKKIIKHI